MRRKQGKTQEEHTMNKETSRRDFLKLAGKGMLGAAALSTVPVVMPAVAEGAEAPAWPWAYKKLDKEAVISEKLMDSAPSS